MSVERAVDLITQIQTARAKSAAVNAEVLELDKALAVKRAEHDKLLHAIADLEMRLLQVVRGES